MKEVAAEAGVSETTVSRFERGIMPKRNPFPLVEAYARVLEIEPAELWKAVVRE